MNEVAVKDSHQTDQSKLQFASLSCCALPMTPEQGRGLCRDGVDNAVILAGHLVFVSLGGPSRGIAGSRSPRRVASLHTLRPGLRFALG